MGGRLLKKSIGNHLDANAIDDAAEGYTTKNGAKHLKRCIHCRAQVRCVKNQLETQRIMEEDGRRRREKRKQQAYASYLLGKDPALLPAAPLTLPWPRLLSGAERDWFWRKIPSENQMIAGAFILSLVFCLLDAALAGIQTRHLELLILLLIVAVIIAVAIGYRICNDNDHDPEDDKI